MSEMIVDLPERFVGRGPSLDNSYDSNPRVFNLDSPRYLVAMRSWGKCLKS